MLEPEDQLKVITRHAVDVVSEQELLAKLRGSPRRMNRR